MQLKLIKSLLIVSFCLFSNYSNGQQGSASDNSAAADSTLIFDGFQKSIHQNGIDHFRGPFQYIPTLHENFLKKIVQRLLIEEGLKTDTLVLIHSLLLNYEVGRVGYKTIALIESGNLVLAKPLPKDIRAIICQPITIGDYEFARSLNESMGPYTACSITEILNHQIIIDIVIQGHVKSTYIDLKEVYHPDHEFPVGADHLNDVLFAIGKTLIWDKLDCMFNKIKKPLVVEY